MKWQIGQKDILAFDEPEVILVNRIQALARKQGL